MFVWGSVVNLGSSTVAICKIISKNNSLRKEKNKLQPAVKISAPVIHITLLNSHTI